MIFSGVSLSWQIFRNNLEASFHSKKFKFFIAWQSAVTFSLLGRYSAVRLILHRSRWSHVPIANWANLKFWVLPVFNRFLKATMLPTWRRIALCFKVFENVCLASFMAKRSTTFMWFFISWADHILTCWDSIARCPPALWWNICLY